MESDENADEQRERLSNFQDFTGVESVEIALQYLVSNNWDVQRAVNTYLTCQSDSDQTPTQTPEPQTTTNNQIVPSPPTSLTRYIFRYAIQLLRAPFSFLYAFYVKCQPVLPWNFARIAFTYFRSFLWPKPIRTPIEEIEEYIRYFDSKYGSRHPTFYCGLLSQALRDAQRENRLLFIYLHDQNSSLCDRLCHEFLCGDAFESMIANHLFWSTSRQTQEGINASQLLHVRAYPSLCIVAHQGSQQNVQLKLERYTDVDLFLAEVLNGIQNADHVLEENRQRRNMSDSRGRLLEEQNAAYHAAMLADQERAEQRMREEEERRLVEEEQQRKLQAFANFRESLKDKIPPEPSSNDSETIQVSIRLPADEPLRRRFSRQDPAKLLFEYAWTQSTVPDRFELLCGYPRQRYRYEKIGDQKIGELIQGNAETCYLQEIDDEEEEE